MNLNDYQKKGSPGPPPRTGDTSFDCAQNYSTTSRKTAGYPAIGHPIIYLALA